MKTTTHTPGPFPLEITKSDDHFVIVTNHGSHFAKTFDPYAAKLIAAAPDLLSALENLAQEYSALLNSNGASAEIGSMGSECKAGEWVQFRLQSPFLKAQAAISKAKGGAE